MTEYQYMACRCSDCGRVTEAADTAGVTRSAFGPSVHALGALLAGAFRMSRRQARAAFAALYGLDISTGAIQNALDRVSEAIAPAVADVTRDVHGAPAVHADETSWPFAGGKGWPWTASTPDAVLSHIDPRRSRSPPCCRPITLAWCNCDDDSGRPAKDDPPWPDASGEGGTQ